MSVPSLFRSIRRFGLPVLAALALAGAGCAAPSPGNGRTAPVASVPTSTAPDAGPAPAAPVPAGRTDLGQPGSQLRPAPRLDAPPSRSPADPASVEIDRSCSTDAECTVKDVGNCCGYYPACVNVDSPTDPEGVKAQCAKSGMSSVCGFPAITSCQCVAGQCKGSNKALLE